MHPPHALNLPTCVPPFPQPPRFLEKTHGGSGVLLAGVPGVPPGSVVVIGAGVAGTNAAVVAAGVGADVVLLDTNIGRLRALAQWLPRNVKTAFSSSAAIENHLAHVSVPGLGLQGYLGSGAAECTHTCE